MRALKTSTLIALSAFVIAGCGGNTPTLPTPAPEPSTPTRPSFSSIVLTGQVTDAATSAPVAGAIVRINGRYSAVTDASGRYSVSGLLDAGSGYDFTYVSAADYVNDYHYIRSSSQDVRLNRIQRITAGESKIVTVAPNDTLCVNNMQDSPSSGQHDLCRSVRIVALTAGTLTIEAVSTQDGAHPPLEVEVADEPVDWSLQNPKSFQVAARTEVAVNVEMGAASTTSQSFMLTTSMTR
jgi:hypothetical protein